MAQQLESCIWQSCRALLDPFNKKFNLKFKKVSENIYYRTVLKDDKLSFDGINTCTRRKQKPEQQLTDI